MLVEDDNNLREIYEARLLAEGYEIVTAKDGEEALALAVKEKPDLIISDVMMPKISGFDMLDILRSTPETKDTKVIMMTALSQAEDKARADKLGADRYLVKSQVTLEDVAKTAHDVIEGVSPVIETIPELTPADAPAVVDPVIAPTAPAAVDPVAPPAEPATTPAATTPELSTDPATTPTPAAVTETAAEPVETPAPEVPATETTPVETPVATEPELTTPEVAEPANPEPAEEPTPATTDETTPTSTNGVEDNLTQTAASEEEAIDAQISSFINGASTDPGTKQVAAPGVEGTEPEVTPATESAPAETPEPATTTEESVAVEPGQETAPAVIAPTTPTSIQVTTPEETSDEPEAPQLSSTGNKRIISPLNDPTVKPDINELIKQEEAATNATVPVTTPAVESVITPGATSGSSVTPAATPTQSGNVVSPGDIAL